MAYRSQAVAGWTLMGTMSTISHEESCDPPESWVAAGRPGAVRLFARDGLIETNETPTPDPYMRLAEQITNGRCRAVAAKQIGHASTDGTHCQVDGADEPVLSVIGR